MSYVENIVLILCFATTLVKASETGANTTTLSQLLTKESLSSTPGVRKVRCSDLDEATLLGNKTIHMKCCKYAFRTFTRRWRSSKARLGEWLNRLKKWQCPQFMKECDHPTFAFTYSNTLTYSRFCTPDKFNAECGNGATTVTRIPANATDVGQTPESSGYIFHDNTAKTVENKNFLGNLAIEELLSPCVQASLFETQNEVQKYFEPKMIEFPFCEIVWCAFPTDVFKTQHISFSVCMPHGCRKNLYILMIVLGIMCAAITFTNVSVLLVLTLKNRSMNSQKVYKMSLAVADLLVGLVVLPTMIESVKQSFLFRQEIVTKIGKTGITKESVTSLNYSYVFFGIAGFCTTLSLAVSIYTLMVASFDRFLVVYRPLEYNKFRAAHTAKIFVGAIWILAVFFSLLPFIVPDLEYAFIASVVVSLAGKVAVALYCILLAAPLLIVWITNVATLICYQRNTRKSGIPCSNVDLNTAKADNELLKTLAVMVGVFTACMFPLVLVTSIQLAMPDIFPDNTKNYNASKASIIMSFEAVAVIILTSNSLWNFFIYNGRSPEFRAGFKSLLLDFLHNPIRCFFKQNIGQERRGKFKSNSSMTDRSMSTSFQEARLKTLSDDGRTGESLRV